MKIKFSNYSMKVGKKHYTDWYEWCVFVDEKSEKVRSIKEVEYTLHPTFPDPIRTVKDKENLFALYSSGWGIFDTKIQITFEDNSTSDQKYTVKLYDDYWPKMSAPEYFEPPDDSAVYNALIDEKYRWRKFDTVIKKTELPKEKVREILERLSNEKLVRKAPFLSLDNKELWAVTAIVGCAPNLSLG